MLLVLVLWISLLVGMCEVLFLLENRNRLTGLVKFLIFLGLSFLLVGVLIVVLGYSPIWGVASWPYALFCLQKASWVLKGESPSNEVLQLWQLVLFPPAFYLVTLVRLLWIKHHMTVAALKIILMKKLEVIVTWVYSVWPFIVLLIVVVKALVILYVWWFKKK